MYNQNQKFLPYNKKLIPIARELRSQPTESERKLWHYILRARQLGGYKFLRQKPILNFIVDFCCAKLRLIIELDGPIHEFKIHYDETRAEAIEELGFKIVRFTNEEILQNIEKVRIELIKLIKLREKEIGEKRMIED